MSIRSDLLEVLTVAIVKNSPGVKGTECGCWLFLLEAARLLSESGGGECPKGPGGAAVKDGLSGGRPVCTSGRLCGSAEDGEGPLKTPGPILDGSGVSPSSKKPFSAERLD